MSKPKEPAETSQHDLRRGRLDQIIDMRHPLVVLTQSIDRGFLAREIGVPYRAGRDVHRCRRG